MAHPPSPPRPGRPHSLLRPAVTLDATTELASPRSRPPSAPASRPASTHSGDRAGTPHASAAQDEPWARFRPRRQHSVRQRSPADDDDGDDDDGVHGLAAAGDDKGSHVSKEGGKDKPPATQSVFRRVWERVENNSVFPVDWVWPAVTKRNNLKVLFRCSLSAWIGMLFILVTETETMLGQASFFVLVIAFMQPPDKSFVENAEIHLFTLLFGAIAWAWVCIAGAICNAIRMNEIPKSEAVPALIFSGAYLESQVSIVCAVFLGVGSGFFCWLKVRTAPSPITLPCVLACIQMDVALTLIPLFPYKYYTSGLVFFLPMAIQIGVSLLASTVIFPSSASYAYLSSLSTLLAPLGDAVSVITDVFDAAGAGDASLNDWITVGGRIKELRVKSSMTGLVAMKRLEGSLGMDISWGRLGVKDLQRLGERAKDVNLRAGGLPFFFDILRTALLHDALDSNAFQARKTLNQSDVDGLNEALSTRANSVYARSEAGSRPVSPDQSDAELSSAPPSPVGELVQLPTARTVASDETYVAADAGAIGSGGGLAASSSAPVSHLSLGLPSTPMQQDPLAHAHTDSLQLDRHAQRKEPAAAGQARARRAERKLHFPLLRARSPRLPSPSRHRVDHHQHKGHGSHFSLLEKLRRVQEPVGLFESQRYMNLEHSLTEHEIEQLHRQLQLLAHSTLPLLRALSDALRHAGAWTARINGDRSFVTRKKALKRGRQFEEENARVVERLRGAMERFKTKERLEIVEPYKHIFDPTHPPPDDIDQRKLPHRQLFWCFAFHFHLSSFGNDVLRLMEEQQAVELKRQHQRLWTPLLAWSRLLPTRNQQESDGQHFGEEDPDKIKGLQPREDSMNGTQRRDPDSMEPSNAFFALLRRIHMLGGMLTSTQGLFAMKACILTVLVATPAWTPQTAQFFYRNRGLWVIIMAQLTLALYSGETAFAFVVRTFATFWGCVIGLTIWAIGAPGDSAGTPFGIGAVTAVAFPLIFVFRLFAPSPPLLKILFSVSTGLVVAYGWQNAHSPVGQLTNASWGWDVTWRRFLCVQIGITAAWVWSWVPPVSSGKRSIRISYSNLIGTLGDGMCSIISEASLHHSKDAKENRRIESNQVAIKTKLNALGGRHMSISYEVSLRGTWPEKRYEALRTTLIDLADLLSQLHFILSAMELPWRKALLTRTQLNNTRFMGDVLAVFSLCSNCLRAAAPLPQITPSPLVERYLERNTYGLKVLESDYIARGNESVDGHGGSENGSHADVHHHEKGHPEGSLPTYLTASTLESEEYMRFALGCSTVFFIVNRLDRLMVVAKTLLGETYHLSGVAAV